MCYLFFSASRPRCRILNWGKIPEHNPQPCLWIVLGGAVWGLNSEREVSLRHTLKIRGLCAHCDVQGQPPCVTHAR
jgi:hypothetical protein